MATIVDSSVLNKIIKNIKKKSIILNEKIIIDNFTYNILHIALFNNPESVQILLGANLFNKSYLEKTEQSMDGFEKVIDIQPASWYYLQLNLKDKYELKLNTEEHWYGYNYKNKLKSVNIKSITHYILDKQELSNNKNKCNICETYSNKVVFTKCKHKVCIVCALHSDKCGTCRITIDEKEKIII
jgi:hypothetical protein